MSELPHDFADPALLELALTHSSTVASLDNERLEFLGDAVLDLVVAEELYRHHEGLQEGDLTEQKAFVVSRKTLAEAAQRMGLDEIAKLGRGLARRALSRSVLANLYEAVLGAVYLDAGLERARTFTLETLREPLTEVRERSHAPNPKQVFQELCQKRWGRPPSYSLLETRGLAHTRSFLVAAEADEGAQQFPSAWGRTRKEAESWAAHEALLVLEDGA
jgi:ribonuclease-3